MEGLLPPYWQPRPPFTLDEATRTAFDDLLDTAIANGPNNPLPYSLQAPKWQFLCYAAEQRGLAMHGSQHPNIAEFEPRQPIDLREFGAQLAVYAAADGIWPMFFAILNRTAFPTSMTNACIRLIMPNGVESEPFYQFSIGRHVIEQYPFCAGTMYLLPRNSFEEEPIFGFGSFYIRSAQLASLQPVVPLAKLVVEPDDFPFLNLISAHDETRFAEFAAAIQSGAPWPE